MDFDDSPAEAAFRAEVRTWLDENAEPRVEADVRLSPMASFGDQAEAIAAARVWQARLAEARWTGVHWPAEHGGRGASLAEALVLAEEIRRYDVPGGVFGIGIAMIGPTLIAHGTPEQQARYLGPLLRGEEIWCQLWSEPDAGSDLANLRSRAVRDGDEFVLDGQKVWTSGAHYARFGLGIFRTDPDVPKHKGISCFVVDLAAPGVTIRPLRQINGEAHFNEVYFDSARIPAANLVGELHDGWRVARTTLMNERFAAGTMDSSGFAFAALARLARAAERDADPVVRQALARLHSIGRVTDLTNARVRSAIANDGIPGAEGSILKLALADLGTAVADAGVAMLGPGGLLTGAGAPDAGRWSEAAMGAFAMHIGGGTDAIQRNIIGERVLGLPREPSTDRNVPFRTLPS
ncbi:MAG: acyl-CoA dehydrogenase family protein [Actinomycetota bacterium]|nr:acyl-CoA dehydrogenase family protein [Acidimicrobiia bacterium]MDQ3293415.1 acyl-CoA dehydrogenase family protein [Actinomycetota bacterium]